jgi:hypothetical protein
VIEIEEISPYILQNENAALEKLVPKTAWQINFDMLRSLEAGDHLSFPVEGVIYTVEVFQKSVPYENITTLLAKYEDESVVYHSVMTIGENSVEVSLVTPEGQFESSLYEGKGNVYGALSIEEQWSDRSLPDTIEVPKVTSNGDLDIIPR